MKTSKIILALIAVMCVLSNTVFAANMYANTSGSALMRPWHNTFPLCSNTTLTGISAKTFSDSRAKRPCRCRCSGCRRRPHSLLIEDGEPTRKNSRTG